MYLNYAYVFRWCSTYSMLMIYRPEAFFSLRYRSYIKVLQQSRYKMKLLQAVKNPSTIQRTLDGPFSPYDHRSCLGASVNLAATASHHFRKKLAIVQYGACRPWEPRTLTSETSSDGSVFNRAGAFSCFNRQLLKLVILLADTMMMILSCVWSPPGHLCALFWLSWDRGDGVTTSTTWSPWNLIWNWT